ncbi:MAG: GNAT family N-acetyltransferase [Lachnospiraceae bacterium]|nr:GNAT family N-acetyltransferase [Lachnospiraceae bacterium]
METIRATETWQRAGAYYVRIQAMAKQYHITLREEFDEHDGPDTDYIVLLDEEFPVATCRFYEIEKDSVMIGRVVVLPEYRNQGLGSRVIQEAEEWVREQGYKKIVLESRDVAVEFYRKLGYEVVSDQMIHGGTFQCIRMEKELQHTAVRGAEK